MLQPLDIAGAPGTTRTCGLRIRSPALYPTELRARGMRDSGMGRSDRQAGPGAEAIVALTRPGRELGRESLLSGGARHGGPEALPPKLPGRRMRTFRPSLLRWQVFCDSELKSRGSSAETSAEAWTPEEFS